MRHDSLEHRRQIPKPFTVNGDLAFVLRAFGMPEDMGHEEAIDAFSAHDAIRTAPGTGNPCTIIEWACEVTDGRTAYTIVAMPIHAVEHPPPPVDPWVVVGRTTIDGDLMELARAFDLSPCGPGECALPTVIGAIIEDRRVLRVGGRDVRPYDSDLDPVHGGVVACEVVRRQSEVDAELVAAVAPSINALAADLRAMSPCPECGPHGNAGRVLLLESWVDCTSCHHPDVLPDGVIDVAPPSGFMLLDGVAHGLGIEAIPAIEDTRASLSASLIGRAEGRANLHAALERAGESVVGQQMKTRFGRSIVVTKSPMPGWGRCVEAKFLDGPSSGACGIFAPGEIEGWS